MRDERLRRDRRVETQQPVEFRSKRGLAMSVWMTDLSPSGCQIRMQVGRLVVGEQINIRPQGFESLTGFVRWVNGDRAGIELSPPLYPSIAEHIARTTVAPMQQKVFGVADTLGRRMLPQPNATIVRSVA